MVEGNRSGHTIVIVWSRTMFSTMVVVSTEGSLIFPATNIIYSKLWLVLRVIAAQGMLPSRSHRGILGRFFSFSWFCGNIQFEPWTCLWVDSEVRTQLHARPKNWASKKIEKHRFQNMSVRHILAKALHLFAQRTLFRLNIDWCPRRGVEQDSLLHAFLRVTDVIHFSTAIASAGGIKPAGDWYTNFANTGTFPLQSHAWLARTGLWWCRRLSSRLLVRRGLKGRVPTQYWQLHILPTTLGQC